MAIPGRYAPCLTVYFAILVSVHPILSVLVAKSSFLQGRNFMIYCFGLFFFLEISGMIETSDGCRLSSPGSFCGAS